MCMDLLDFTFRIEKAFQIKVPRDAYDRLPRRTPFDTSWNRNLLCDIAGAC